jgi:dTDP-4-dehydrorhamnose reductase
MKPTIPIRAALAQQPLQLWGGIECTVVRLGENFRNQLIETGHFGRIEDIHAIARLGIKTLRYPVLWETVAPDHPDECDWHWCDERLHLLHECGIAPIAGLVHHGSGPCYTNLLDPAFPELAARYAARVAARYPWIELFTPVNEPLTTARFSGLYGHWYPHGRDVPIFLRALVIQCHAIVLSMQAIRRITPAAQLVQTEDLGKAFSTPLLSYQAEMENQRRWLSLDLLCGRVDSSHPWHATFLQSGIGQDTLDFFREAKCVPDIIGINHYLTSERFLDHRVRYYPTFLRDYNGHHRYVDVEAMRADFPPGQLGPEARLREAWERYRLPIAVTEAHHGNARDEQVRWLLEVWNAAHNLRNQGADIRAVTVWSIFGCVDWNTLLTQKNGFYEAGVFDVRCTPPRPTALANAVAALAATGDFDHPVLDQPGWWRRDNLLYVGAESKPAARRRLLITGGTGTLGQAFSRICDIRGLDHDLLARADMDIADPQAVGAVLRQCRPWALINAAGYVRVADADREAERCNRENAVGAHLLAKACATLGIPYITFSSDLVFDGQLGRPYVESDRVAPICIYGASKVEAELLVMQEHPQALIIRTSAFFGPWDRHNFVYTVLRDLAAGRKVEASDEVKVSPTYVPDLVNETLDLLIDGAHGVWHLANQGMLSWHEFAQRVAREAGVDASSLIRGSNGRTGVTALSSERSYSMPSLESAIQRFVHDSSVAWDASGGASAVARE